MNVSASDIETLNSLNVTHLSHIKQEGTSLTHSYLGTSIVLGGKYKIICINVKGTDHINHFANLNLSDNSVHHTDTCVIRTVDYDNNANPSELDHAQFYYKLDANRNRILRESCFTHQHGLLDLDAAVPYHGQVEFQVAPSNTDPFYQVTTKSEPSHIPTGIWTQLIETASKLQRDFRLLLSPLTDTNIAKYYLKRCPDTIVYDVSSKHLYLENNNNIWHKDTADATDIIDELEPVLCQFKKHCYYLMQHEVNHDDNDQLQEAQTNLARIDGYVRSKKKRRVIISLLKQFAPKINFSNHKQPTHAPQLVRLFACDNAVFDLQHHMIRLAKPDEYITMACGYNYVPLYSDDVSSIQDKINSFIGSLTLHATHPNLMHELALLLGHTNSTTYHVYLGQSDAKHVFGFVATRPIE